MLLPDFLRKENMQAWIDIIASPVVFLYQDLLRFRSQKLYELGITPQVVHLERMLNDRYDFADRRITIVDGVEYDPIYLFGREEVKPVYFYARSEDAPVTVYTRGESGDLTNDFVVLVPAAVTFDINEMTSLVKSNKLPSMRFKIQIV